MKFILPLSVAFLFIACTKSTTSSNTGDEPSFYIEEFRKPGMDDFQTIMAACDSLPENSKIIFAAKTYIISHTPIIEKSFQFLGPATFKRENQVTYTLKEPATAQSTYLVLNSTVGLAVPDRIEVCVNNEFSGATPINVVTRISGDTVMLNVPVARTFGGHGSYPAGTKLFKSINFFWILSHSRYTDMNCSFNNLTFDGNRDNNTGSYSWNMNAAVTAISKGTTYYKNCTFINSPNESIVGHNADIRDCVFYNLNGSGYHTVADREYCPESDIHSFLTYNLFQNTNEVLSTITGHSEGVITHSQCGGYYVAKGNVFENVGESVLGSLAPGISPQDWGTSNITFTGNIVNGAARMVYAIDTSFPGTIHDVKIEKNLITNVISQDWTKQLQFWPGIVLRDKSNE